MDKQQDEIRKTYLKGANHEFLDPICKIDDPCVAVLVLAGMQHVVMSVENGVHVFRLNATESFEAVVEAAIEGDPKRMDDVARVVGRLRSEAESQIDSVHRSVEAAARLWRPVNVVVSGVRDDGGERR